jgi:16S rRNA (guanine527-N7)-methyltransferase
LRGDRVADLGTGAGLPGIPLAIAEPGRRFVLIDRHARRLAFVRQAIIELSLANVETEQVDFAGYRPAELFDTVVSRAVREPNKLWEAARHLLAAGGRIVALSGQERGHERGHEMAPETGPEAGPRSAPGFEGAGEIQNMVVTIPGLERQHRLVVVDQAAGGTEAEVG